MFNIKSLFSAAADALLSKTWAWLMPTPPKPLRPAFRGWNSSELGTKVLGNNMLKRAADSIGSNNKERRKLRRKFRTQRDALVVQP